MKAKDLMTAKPACCTPESTSRQVAKLMEENDCGSLPVVESDLSQKLVGVVTDRDLALRVLGRGLSPDTPVREVMSSDVACVSPDESLDEVEKLMSQRQVRRIPVVDESRRVLGVIAQADLARERKAIGENDFGKVIERISEPAGVR